MIPANDKRNADERPLDHEKRRASAERWAEWHLGDGAHAHDILFAYWSPDEAMAALDAEIANET